MLGQAGPMLSHLGLMLGPCWAIGPILDLYWPRLGLCWAMLGPSWTYIGPGWAYVGLCWAHLGPMLALCGPMFSHLGSYVGAMFGPSTGAGHGARVLAGSLRW